MPQRRTFRNIILPAVLLIPLLWIMTGCFYFPFFEHRIDSGPNVRAMVGDVGSDRPIAPGRISRQEVIGFLGEPPLVSDDGTAIGYEATTSNGSWVWPLCFDVEPADARTYIVRLVFDGNGELVRYDWTDAAEAIPSFTIRGGYGYPRDDAAVAKLNKSTPQLRYANKVMPFQPTTSQTIDPK